ncbi:hypothetical protein ACGYKB_18480 [Sulfitobacter sp. 916]|uniref:hypothetical protein n=1 Tax=Sulfitobacter sp. 916 TaxID=3368559 RepID=UPI00374505F0
MVQKLEDLYSQELRIDLMPASTLADLRPAHDAYRAAATRGAFIVSVLQGDVDEGAHVLLEERILESLSEARTVYENFISQHPEAAHFDFVANPPNAPS